MPELIALPPIPVGKIKTFGDVGEKYEVGRALRQIDDGDWLVEIKLVATGEIVEYRLTHILDDPEAR
jgi:hypothetical protein